MREDLNRSCLGCIYLNRACDGMTDPEQCKSQSPEARRQFLQRRLHLESYNSMCTDCRHFGNVCSGTKCQAWSGCILKDHTPKEAEAYIKSMSEYWEAAALVSEIDRQAEEARREDLTDEEIINNRFL